MQDVILIFCRYYKGSIVDFSRSGWIVDVQTPSGEASVARRVAYGLVPLRLRWVLVAMVLFILRELLHFLVVIIKPNARTLFANRDLYMFYILTATFIMGMILSVYCMVNLIHFAGKALANANRNWKFVIRCFPFLFMFNHLFDGIGKAYQIKMMKWLVFTTLCFIMTFVVGYYRASFM